MRNVVYIKPKLLRRICSAIIDFILLMVLGVFFSFAITPIIENTSSYKENMSIYNEYAVASGLYQFDEEHEKIIQYQIKDEQILIDFYCNKTANEETYVTKKKESNLYDYDENTKTFTKKEETTDEQLYTFYTRMQNIGIDSYLNDYIESFDEAKKASHLLAAYNLLELSICAFLGLLIVYILIPLIFKDGISIGKLMFRLRIVSTKGNGQVRKLQLFFRGLVIIFFEMIASIYTMSMFYVPLFLVISLIIMFVNKKQLTFHDLVCSTMVVDSENRSNIRESEKIIITYPMEETKNGK